ncbi:protein-L-isoaspartate(D-aspartate) O-methyltransferase [Arsukibacterium ikkense]|uniref:Protein-L-isoaspartate(D-aspartate) O-methyltransferase n=1 Tax=Arsukibacterium ikkense TaxID=336831 RepID=A0A0M2V9S7_9GAMM|nr:ATPase, T2SS/T4P/T4SS family [Arsukibacterium ikkense]KKO45918.1 protein-L-isoaspartate(D-aspartate) O-methyltransferase [Arsukibacterium ikkense]
MIPVNNQITEQIPRQLFVSTAQNAELVSGHSMPTQAAVQRILQLLPEIKPQHNVMHIGAGTGYLSAVLSGLAAKVFAVERDARLIRDASQRFATLGINNIQLVLADVNDGIGVSEPCQLILATCLLSHYEQLVPLLTENGLLVVIEDEKDHVSNFVLYQKQHVTLIRQHKLGWIDFSRRLADMVIDLGYADDAMLAEAKLDAKRNNELFAHALNRKIQQHSKDLYEAMAAERQLSFIDFDSLIKQVDSSLFNHFSRTFLDRSRALPVTLQGNRMTVVTDNPDADLAELAVMNGNGKIHCVLVTPEDFRRLWTQLEVSAKAQHKSGLVSKTHPEDTAADALPSPVNPYLVSLYEALLLEAVSEHASDIHLECYQNTPRVRLRIDGDLHDLTHFQVSMSELAGLINVIKIRAELDIAERRLPQGGRSQVKQGKHLYDLRVQTQPSLHAEHVVIRLLKHTGRAMTMQDLGMSPRVAAMYQRLLNNPAGLVLVVGPTGSGKSTTLYAGLQELADDGKRKVITVEDPIEYSIDKVQQTRVRADIGFDFPDAVRAFVRQDPDVILVGEIRDHPTALEAARASQTGHLVLSTLHCNDAVDAIQRLKDLNIHPNSIASELLAVIAQRLAKRICPDCRAPAEPDLVILGELFPDGVPGNFRCFAGAGCSRCHGRGTLGRIAVVEFLLMNTDIRNAISRENTASELRWQALDAGMITMRDSALNLVIDGIIPLHELPKVLLQERMAPEHRGGVQQL